MSTRVGYELGLQNCLPRNSMVYVLWSLGIQWSVPSGDRCDWFCPSGFEHCVSSCVCVHPVTPRNTAQVTKQRLEWTCTHCHVEWMPCKTENQQGPTGYHRGLCSMLCGSLDGRGVWGRLDTHMFGWAPLLSTWNSHNIVNWLYSNIN